MKIVITDARGFLHSIEVEGPLLCLDFHYSEQEKESRSILAEQTHLLKQENIALKRKLKFEEK